MWLDLPWCSHPVTHPPAPFEFSPEVTEEIMSNASVLRIVLAGVLNGRRIKQAASANAALTDIGPRRRRYGFESIESAIEDEMKGDLKVMALTLAWPCVHSALVFTYVLLELSCDELPRPV